MGHLSHGDDEDDTLRMRMHCLYWLTVSYFMYHCIHVSLVSVSTDIQTCGFLLLLLLRYMFAITEVRVTLNPKAR